MGEPLASGGARRVSAGAAAGRRHRPSEIQNTLASEERYEWAEGFDSISSVISSAAPTSCPIPKPYAAPHHGRNERAGSPPTVRISGFPFGGLVAQALSAPTKTRISALGGATQKSTKRGA